MKQFITFLAIAVLAVACEKSTIENEKSVGAATQKVAGIVGTWKLVAYWQDAGNGTGRWLLLISQNVNVRRRRKFYFLTKFSFV